MEVGIFLRQDACELQRSLHYVMGTQNELFAVLTEQVWAVSGTMTGKRRQNVSFFAFTEEVKVFENIQTWWVIETCASIFSVVSQSKKKLQSQKSKGARDYDNVYRRVVWGGYALEWTGVKSTEQLQLILGSASVTGAKMSNSAKPVWFVSAVKRYKGREEIHKEVGRGRNENIPLRPIARPFALQERVVFATSSSSRPEQA